jgi:hypothetical protein
MNLALPALVVFLLLLPGFIARSRIKRAERQSLDYSPFGQIVSEAVLWSIALHLLWTAVTGLVAGKAIDPQTVLRLMSAEASIQTQALQSVAAQASGITLYFTTLLVFAHLSPWVVRRVVERYRLDRQQSHWSPLLRFSAAPWYYLFSGADFEESDVPDLISVSAVVDVAGEPYLYVGLLEDYFMTHDGELDRVVLQHVMRRPLSRDKGPDHVHGDLSRFYPIDGDYFVLRYVECITLNIEYIKLGPANVSATGEQSETDSPHDIAAEQSAHLQALSAEPFTPRPELP